MVSPEALAASISAAAVAIAKNKTTEELDLLSIAFTQLGDTLGTISAARSFCDSAKSTTANADTTANTANATTDKAADTSS